MKSSRKATAGRAALASVTLLVLATLVWLLVHNPDSDAPTTTSGRDASATPFDPPLPLVLAISDGAEVEHEFHARAGGFDITAQWSAGDVVLSLRSPSGRVIDRHTVAEDVTHEVGPTYESYHVTSPERGVWTATLHGAHVAPQGEVARLDIHQAPAENTPPTARMEQTLVGRTVTVDASGSSDADGTIVRYLWEFGDGATADGPSASHTYTEAGTYLISLATLDNRGRWDVVSAPDKLKIAGP